MSCEKTKKYQTVKHHVEIDTCSKTREDHNKHTLYKECAKLHAVPRNYCSHVGRSLSQDPGRSCRSRSGQGRGCPFHNCLKKMPRGKQTQATYSEKHKSRLARRSSCWQPTRGSQRKQESEPSPLWAPRRAPWFRGEQLSIKIAKVQTSQKKHENYETSEINNDLTYWNPMRIFGNHWKSCGIIFAAAPSGRLARR